MIKIILLFVVSAFAECPKELTRVEVPGLGHFTAKGPFNSLFPKVKDGKQIGYTVGAMDHTFKAMGFQRFDVITEVNGKAFNTQDLMVEGMDTIVVGRSERKVCVTFYRKDEKFEKHFHLVPGPTPAPAAKK